MPTPKNNENETAAMILAAGMGTRLLPLTESAPKALVPVSGRPMIHYPLLWLKSQGIKNIFINTHHLGDMVQNQLGNGDSFGVNITYSPETTLLGTGGGIANARKLFGRRRLVVVNADTIIDADLEAMTNTHTSSNAIATIAVTQAKNPQDFTPITIDSQGRVIKIGDMPEIMIDPEAPCHQKTFTGLSILEPELIDTLPPNKPSCLIKNAIIPAIAQNKTVMSYHHPGYWIPLDNTPRIEQAHDDINSGAFRPDFMNSA